MTRVIKIGGRPQSDASLPGLIAEAWRAGEALVIVHGGGDEVSTLQSALGGSTQFVGGRRVTTERDVDIVRMALSGSANKRLVASLVAAGLNAVGISGEDAALIDARTMDETTLGRVGEPATINAGLLRHLIAGGYLPVVSPVSRDMHASAGAALNVNGDDAAAAIALALGADELLLVADVEGVMSDGCVVPRLTTNDARRMIADGTAGGGMRAKLQAALTALDGVGKVRISDIAAIRDTSRGTTMLYSGGRT